MEKFFCKSKRIIAMLLLTLMITIFIVPISKAAYTDSMIKGKEYEYKGNLIISYKTKDAARKSNIFKIKDVLTKGEKIVVEEIDGDILKIGNQEYIKLNVLNSASKFKLISQSEQPEESEKPQELEDLREIEDLQEREEPEEPEVEEEQPREPQLPEEIKVTGIKLNKENGNLYEELGGKYKLKATVTPENATNKNVKWESNNTKVLTVNQNGEITWKSIGTATITAITEDGGFKATCKIRVTRLEINKSKLKLNIGEKSELEINYAGAGKKKDIIWTSNNEKIAKVDEDGIVTAIGEGTAIITAKAQHANIKLECKVTVKKVAVNKIKLNKTSVSLNKGDTVKLKATIEPTNATNKEVIWKSDNEKIAKVDENGIVTAKATGKTKIRAKVDGKEAICEIIVNQKVTSITLNKTSASLKIGDTVALTATIKPSNATNKNVTWKSDNENIAKVDENGKVTAMGGGTTKIIVTSKDVSSIKAVCTITVVDPYKYTFGGNTYKIAVTSDKLNEVLNVIDVKNIEQKTNRNASDGLAGKCGAVSNYYIRMLYGQINLSKASRSGAKYQSTLYNSTVNSSEKIKAKVDNKVLTRLHLKNSDSSTHWAVVIGYKGEGKYLSDYLLLDPYPGKLVKGGTGTSAALYNNRWEARVINKP